MARPGVKHLGTLCVVDNTPNKAGLGAEGRARPRWAGPERAPPRAGGRARWRAGRGGSVEGLPPAQPPPGVSTNIYSTRKQQLLPFQ